MDFDRVNSDYYSSKLSEIREHRRVRTMLATVRPSLLSILDATIARIQQTH